MEIDKNIQKKLAERAIQPSTSSWERLSNQLDSYERRKRRRKFFYISSAASILLLVSIYLLSTKNDNIDIPVNKENIIVESPKEDKTFKEKIDELIEKNEILIVEAPVSKKVPNIQKKAVKKRPKKRIAPMEESIVTSKETIAHQENPVIKSTERMIAVSPEKKSRKTRISVNSDALLYSVTHTEEEVIAYYKKYQLNRKDIINSIEQQLRKSNLKVAVNASTILAEVEREIDDASFKKNFMKIIKRRVSDLATAIASRND